MNCHVVFVVPSFFDSKYMTVSKSPSPAKKSPVIISQEGEIEEHIDIESHDENNSSNPAMAEKEVFVIPHALDTDRNDTGAKKFFSTYAAYIIVSGIILVVLTSRYTHIDVLSYPAPSMDPLTIDQPNDNALRSVIELKDIAKLIIQDTGTDTRTVDSFIDKWILLDDTTKLEFSSSFWFERFSKLLDEKVKFYTPTEAFEDKQTTQYKDALLNMASIIGVVDMGATSTPLKTDEDFEQIFQAISSEIAKAEEKEKGALKYPPETSTLADESPAEEHMLAGQAESPVEKITINTSTQGFAEPDINYLLGRYATTYEFGSTRRIMALFSTNSEYKRRLMRSFNKVFSSSSKRRIEFSNLNWTFLDNTIIGNGDYKAYIKLKNNKGTRSINAQIRVKMHVKNNELQIAKLDFSNVEVNRTKPNNFPQPRKRIKTQTYPLTAPTATELQDVVARFISAYESGNMKALDSIFSKNAKTNDHNGLKAIKRDYRNLFSRTTDRQLFIENIKWSFRKNQAQGIGKLNVLLHSGGNSKIRTQQGKINIAAKKLNDKVLITHLYHKVSNN